MNQKIVIISGASSGLGKATAELLANKNYKVFALARSAKKIQFDIKNIIPIACNIRDLHEIDSAFATIDSQTDHIDILINCAGRALVKPFSETSREEIMDVFGVNLKGNIYIAQEVYKRMIPQKSGHIINVGSTSSLRARDREIIYCASKWGIRGFTESLRLEAKQHSIFVTGVYPGGMQSENFWENTPSQNIDLFMKPEDVAEEIMQVIEKNPRTSLAEIVIERPDF